MKIIKRMTLNVIWRCYSTSLRSELRNYWSSSFPFGSLWTSPAAPSINLQKKNSTNISAVWTDPHLSHVASFTPPSTSRTPDFSNQFSFPSDWFHSNTVTLPAISRNFQFLEQSFVSHRGWRNWDSTVYHKIPIIIPKHQDNSQKQLKTSKLIHRGLTFGWAYYRKDICV